MCTCLHSNALGVVWTDSLVWWAGQHDGKNGGCIFKVDTPKEKEKKRTTTFKTLVMVARAFEETFVMVARVIERTIIKWKVGWQERVVVARAMTENEIKAEDRDKDVVMLKLKVVFLHKPLRPRVQAWLNWSE